MNGRQKNQRKTLRPIPPSKCHQKRKHRVDKVTKKRETFISYNFRDHRLTKHQLSWARALSVSLSGWRDRQKFLQAQMEAQQEAEAKPETEEADKQTEEQAQNDRLELNAQPAATSPLTEATSPSSSGADSDSGSGSGSDSESSLEPDSRGDEHEVIPNGEECTFGDFYELVTISQWKAQRKSEERLRNAVKGNNDTATAMDEIDGDFNDDKPQTLAQQVQIPPNVLALPVVQPASNVDWRARAHAGILRKKLSITKGWSAMTWNQKSNVQERLLLLEDDNYPIAELQERKATSEEITAIILERAAASQRPQGQTTSSVTQTQGDSKSSSAPETNTTSIPEKYVINHAASAAPATAPSHMDPPPMEAQVGTNHHIVPRLDSQTAANTTAVRNKTQPFSFEEPYQPQESPQLKRKRASDSNPEQSENNTANACPARKKQKCTLLTKEDARLHALRETKRKVLRQVFRPVRSVCAKSLPSSRIMFAPVIAHVHGRCQGRSSTLQYLHADQPLNSLPNRTLTIGVQGLNLLMAELRFLTDSGDSVQAFSIYDPDYDEAFHDLSASAEARIKQKMQEFRRQKLSISLKKDEKGRLLVQGDTLTLIELIKVLREKPLLHRVVWEWDGLQLQPSDSLQWSLGVGTHSTLRSLEHELRQYAQTGGIEISVGISDCSQTD